MQIGDRAAAWGVAHAKVAKPLASQTYVFIQGVCLIEDFSSHTLAKEKATKFWNEHHTEENKDIPEGFWREVEAMMMGDGPLHR